MAEAELAEADQGAIQSGEEEGREEAPPQHYLLPEVLKNYNMYGLIVVPILFSRVFFLCETVNQADRWCSLGELWLEGQIG